MDDRLVLLVEQKLRPFSFAINVDSIGRLERRAIHPSLYLTLHGCEDTALGAKRL